MGHHSEKASVGLRRLGDPLHPGDLSRHIEPQRNGHARHEHHICTATCSFHIIADVTLVLVPMQQQLSPCKQHLQVDG